MVPAMRLRNIRVRDGDLVTLRKECREIFKKHHPSVDPRVISDSFMLHQLVWFYIENDEA
jgi:hypothetical protein